jgi:hypothetical protein
VPEPAPAPSTINNKMSNGSRSISTYSSGDDDDQMMVIGHTKSSSSFKKTASSTVDDSATVHYDVSSNNDRKRKSAGVSGNGNETVKKKAQTSGSNDATTIDLTGNDDDDTKGNSRSLAPIFRSRGDKCQSTNNRTLSTAKSAPGRAPAAGSAMDSSGGRQTKIRPINKHSFSPTVLPKRSAEEASRDTQRILNDIFGLQKLRHLQPKAISDALQLRSQLIVMATGGGK